MSIVSLFNFTIMNDVKWNQLYVWVLSTEVESVLGHNVAFCAHL